MLNNEKNIQNICLNNILELISTVLEGLINYKNINNRLLPLVLGK